MHRLTARFGVIAFVFVFSSHILIAEDMPDAGSHEEAIVSSQPYDLMGAILETGAKVGAVADRAQVLYDYTEQTRESFINDLHILTEEGAPFAEGTTGYDMWDTRMSRLWQLANDLRPLAEEFSDHQTAAADIYYTLFSAEYFAMMADYESAAQLLEDAQNDLSIVRQDIDLTKKKARMKRFQFSELFYEIEHLDENFDEDGNPL